MVSFLTPREVLQLFVEQYCSDIQEESKDITDSYLFGEVL